MIYLDNCASTKPRKHVLKKMYEYSLNNYANPSSIHNFGYRVEKDIENSRKSISQFLGINSAELYFTSGGTESNNLILNGVLSKGSNYKHVITTVIEHPSIYKTLNNIEKKYKNIDVSYIGVDKSGRIKINELEKSLNQDTVLVSLIHVNNEIGTIQNIENIVNIVKNYNKKIIIHIDGVQSFGKLDINLKELGVDSYSFSGHKIHGPKGIGGLYLKKGLEIESQLYGGSQEKGLRAGTENTIGIIGLEAAVDIARKNLYKNYNHVKFIKEYTIKKIKSNIKSVKINSPKESSPYILSVSFKDIRAEVLVHYLEQHKIYLSTTSACSSKGTDKSNVLRSIGLNDNMIEGTIRICYSYENTKEDIDVFVEELYKAIKEIRDIMG